MLECRKIAEVEDEAVPVDETFYARYDREVLCWNVECWPR